MRQLQLRYLPCEGGEDERAWRLGWGTSGPGRKRVAGEEQKLRKQTCRTWAEVSTRRDAREEAEAWQEVSWYTMSVVEKGLVQNIDRRLIDDLRQLMIGGTVHLEHRSPTA